MSSACEAALAAEAEDLVLLVLLCSWLSIEELTTSTDEWDLLDYFCGEGRIAKLASKVGLKAAACDINLLPRTGQSTSQARSGRHARWPMDINGEVGFVFLVVRLRAPAGHLG